MRILFKMTSRSRRTNFIRAIDSVINNLNQKDKFHILISLDNDDDAMKPLPVINCPHTYKVYEKKEGEIITKISAINRDLNDFLKIDSNYQIIINLSDDMVFVQKDFDNIIREAFIDYSQSKEGIINLNQYLHFNDGNQKANVSTMHIVGREYYKRFNYIYHSDYQSVWCDAENDLVAKELGCYRYMGDSLQLFKHLHPAWKLAEMDEQYKKTEAFEVWKLDEQTFNRRKQNNFPII